jgi:hypothetical protein
MMENRKHHRKVEVDLPQPFKNISLRVGNASFPCRAVDASVYGLGLVAEARYLSRISLRETVVLAFDDFQVTAEVLNLAPNYGYNAFRLGVLLADGPQLDPYKKLFG